MKTGSLKISIFEIKSNILYWDKLGIMKSIVIQIHNILFSLSVVIAGS